MPSYLSEHPGFQSVPSWSAFYQPDRPPILGMDEETQREQPSADSLESGSVALHIHRQIPGWEVKWKHQCLVSLSLSLTYSVEGENRSVRI